MGSIIFGFLLFIVIFNISGLQLASDISSLCTVSVIEFNFGRTNTIEYWSEAFVNKNSDLSLRKWRVINGSRLKPNNNIFANHIRDTCQIFIFVSAPVCYDWGYLASYNFPLTEDSVVFLNLISNSVTCETNDFKFNNHQTSEAFIYKFNTEMTRIVETSIVCQFCSPKTTIPINIMFLPSKIIKLPSISSMNVLTTNFYGQLVRIYPKRIFTRKRESNPELHSCLERSFTKDAVCKPEYKFIKVLATHLNFSVFIDYNKTEYYADAIALIELDSVHVSNASLKQKRSSKYITTLEQIYREKNYNYLRGSVFLNFAYCRSKNQRKLMDILFWLEPFDYWTFGCLCLYVILQRTVRTIFIQKLFSTSAEPFLVVSKKRIQRIIQILSSILMLTIGFEYRSFVKSSLMVPVPPITIRSLKELVIENNYKVMYKLYETNHTIEEIQLFNFIVNLFESVNISKKNLIEKYLMPSNLTKEDEDEYFVNGYGTKLDFDIASSSIAFTPNSTQYPNVTCLLVDDERKVVRFNYYFFLYGSRPIYIITRLLDSCGIIDYWYEFERYLSIKEHIRQKILNDEQESSPTRLGLKDSRVRSIFLIVLISLIGFVYLILERIVYSLTSKCLLIDQLNTNFIHVQSILQE